MKKSLTLIVLTFIFCHGFSQSINYGIGAGLNYSSLGIDNFESVNPKYKIGFQINAVFGYNISDKIGFRTEPGLVNRGAILSSPNLSDSKIDINYLTIPVLVRFSPVEKFSILLGPELAYRLIAKSTTDDNTSDINSIYNSKIDFGINAGLLYRVFDKIDLGLRYNRGFISAIKDLRTTDEYGNDKGKVRLFNKGFTFSITYMIK